MEELSLEALENALDDAWPREGGRSHIVRVQAQVVGPVIAGLIRRARREAFEEGRCAASRGVKVSPYIDNPSKDEED